MYFFFIPSFISKLKTDNEKIVRAIRNQIPSIEPAQIRKFEIARDMNRGREKRYGVLRKET